MLPTSLAVAVAAYFTATLSGIAGIGGGTILIGIFYAVGLAPAVAVPLHAVVQLISNGSRTVAYFRHVQWRAALWFMLGALPAPFVIAPWVANSRWPLGARSPRRRKTWNPSGIARPNHTQANQ